MLRLSLPALAASLLLSCTAQAFEICDVAKDPKAFSEADRWALIAEQGKDGWIFAQGELLTPADIGASVGPLRRFAAALRSVGTLPILVDIPGRMTVAEDKLDPARPEFSHYTLGSMERVYARHLKALKGGGWVALDLVDLARSSGLNAEFFNDKDHHWSTQGARAVAARIASLVKADPGWAGTRTTAFRLDERTVRNPGSYRWVVLSRCGVDIPARDSTSYKAVPVQEVSEDSLLGDAPPADVVLVGTSQSRRQDFDAIANRQYFEDSFSALLRSDLQADVLNLAAAGGGTFTSIDGWLTSNEFQRHKPRVLIWEMNDVDGFEHPGALRSLAPAVYGTCASGDAVVAARGAAGDPVELTVPANSKVAGSDYYLSLKLSDKSVLALQVVFDHQGQKDAVPIKRSPLLPNSGRFFTELSASIRRPLSSVSVTLPAGTKGRWDARVCRVR